MHQEQNSIGKSLFVFFMGLPYALFRILYFIITIPRRMRKQRAYEHAPKHIRFHRLADVPISILSAVEHISRLPCVETRQPGLITRPTMMQMLEALWDESMSEAWKFPTVQELMSIQSEILADLATLPIPSDAYFVGAIDEDTHMFVVCNMRTGNLVRARPKYAHDVFRGSAPDAQELCFVYAVSVSMIAPTQ